MTASALHPDTNRPHPGAAAPPGPTPTARLDGHCPVCVCVYVCVFLDGTTADRSGRPTGPPMGFPSAREGAPRVAFP